MRIKRFIAGTAIAIGLVFAGTGLADAKAPVLFNPPKAVVAFAPPTLTFDNSAGNTFSALTTYKTTDPAWNYSAHTFSVPAGVVCGPNFVRITPVLLAESGFRCESRVPAHTVLVVTVT